MPDLTTLIGAKSSAAIYNECLAAIAAAGVRITNWRTGGPYKTFLGVQSVILEKLYQLAGALASGAYLDTASGAWLTALGSDLFQEPRQAALSAEGIVRLQAAAGAGPYTYGPGSLIVASRSGRRYRGTNTAPITLPLAGAVEVTVKAEQPGAVWNVGVGEVVMLVSPTNLGVSVTNPAQPSGTWLTSSGADEESDVRYRERLRSKWATLVLRRSGQVEPSAVTEASYRYLAQTASPEVVLCSVATNNRNGVFTAMWVTLVIAGDGAVVSDAAVTAVRTAINPLIYFGTYVDVKKGQPTTVQLVGTVYVPSAWMAEAPARIAASLDDLRRRAGLGGIIYRTQIIDSIHYASGRVRNVDLQQPVADPLVLGWDRFLQWDLSGLAFQGV